ncbi:MAG: ATPase domain-containing protein [Candidatus Altiarchaeota archaeon]
MSEMVKTGIKGLDEILVGGIPKGHCVLVAGSCGTGKTVLCHEFLFRGAAEGGRGAYISLVEPAEKMLSSISSFKFYNPSFVKDGRIKVVEMTQDVRLRGVDFSNVEELIKIIRDIVEDASATHVAIDSITALCESIGDKDRIRDFILELGHQLTYLGCTTMMISETPPQTFKYSMFGVEEFIADGVILLSDVERKGELIRTLQVIKMRGVAHSRNKQVMKIMDNGIVLLPMFKAEME